MSTLISPACGPHIKLQTCRLSLIHVFVLIKKSWNEMTWYYSGNTFSKRMNFVVAGPQRLQKASDTTSSSGTSCQKNNEASAASNAASPKSSNFSSGSEENICTINNCNKKFLSKESLLAHQRRIHAPPTAHVCPNCADSFSTKPNLNRHVSWKGNTKAFLCTHTYSRQD